jgi:hypothetical protein
VGFQTGIRRFAAPESVHEFKQVERFVTARRRDVGSPLPASILKKVAVGKWWTSKAPSIFTAESPQKNSILVPGSSLPVDDAQLIQCARGATPQD